MIPRNAEPIEHRPPRAPIDLNPRQTGTAGSGDAYEPLSREKCEELWKLLQQAAEGRGGPVVPAEVCDESGWESA